MTLAPRVMVVSPQKTGTHLVLELMVALGYRAFGAIRPSPRNIPRFDTAQRRQIAALVLSAEDYQDLIKTEGSEEFIRRTDEAWSALAWSWQRRLGQPVANRYGQELHDSVDLIATNPRFSSTRFGDTPSGICWIWHELDITRVDGGFIGEWTDTGEPPVILNYRDPRDALVSLINFVDGQTPQGFGNFFERRVYNAILRQKRTMHEKLEYALRDQYFLAREEFEKALWLLNHPWVCKVRYEDLVGPEGGGAEELQRATVERILRHLGADVGPDDIAGQLYNTSSWSFHKGRTGAWREAFSSANLREFYRQYGDILEQFGYE
jgi:hypothetical protein